MQEFSCKVGLVFGGAGSIGKLLCRELLKNGLKAVIVCDKNEENGEKFFEELQHDYHPDKSDYICADVSSNTDMLKTFKYVAKNFQQLDYVINSAAVVNECDWWKLIGTNLVGVISGTYYGFNFIKKYKHGDEGTVLNITSNVALLPISTAPTFCGVSNAVVGFGRSVGNKKNYEKFKTNVVTICLGQTCTDLHSKAKDLYGEAAKQLPAQETCVAVKEIIKVLSYQKNGDVFEIEEGNTYLLEFLSSEQLQKH